MRNVWTGRLRLRSASAALEAWRIAYLGSKGRLKAMMPLLKDVPREEKPAVGKRLNEVKTSLETAFDVRQSDGLAEGPSGPVMDVTEPGLPGAEGCRHVLSRTIAEVAASGSGTRVDWTPTAPVSSATPSLPTSTSVWPLPNPVELIVDERCSDA